MPKNIEKYEIETLEDLVALWAEAPDRVIAWLYVPTLARLHRRFSDVPQSLLADGFSKAAEELDGLVRIASSLDHFQNLVFRTATRRALDILRKRRRRADREASLDAPMAEGDGDQSNEHLVALGLETAEANARHKYFEEIRPVILARLTPTEKRHLSLIEDGYKPYEVSQLMGWTPNTTWVRKSELMKKVGRIARSFRNSEEE